MIPFFYPVPSTPGLGQLIMFSSHCFQFSFLKNLVYQFTQNFIIRNMKDFCGGLEFVIFFSVKYFPVLAFLLFTTL